jgi:hypothetical protein
LEARGRAGGLLGATPFVAAFSIPRLFIVSARVRGLLGAAAFGAVALVGAVLRAGTLLAGGLLGATPFVAAFSIPRLFIVSARVRGLLGAAAFGAVLGETDLAAADLGAAGLAAAGLGLAAEVGFRGGVLLPATGLFSIGSREERAEDSVSVEMFLFGMGAGNPGIQALRTTQSATAKEKGRRGRLMGMRRDEGGEKLPLLRSHTHRWGSLLPFRGSLLLPTWSSSPPRSSSLLRGALLRLRRSLLRGGTRRR